MHYLVYGVMAVIVALVIYIGLGMWVEATRKPAVIIHSPQPIHKPAPGAESRPDVCGTPGTVACDTRP